jgi:F-type H+-transporting ATPase subunit a
LQKILQQIDMPLVFINKVIGVVAVWLSLFAFASNAQESINAQCAHNTATPHEVINSDAQEQSADPMATPIDHATEVNAANANTSETHPTDVPHGAVDHNKELDVKAIIFGHIMDAHDWHFFSIKDKHFSIPLPVILYSPTKGFTTCMSSAFHHGEKEVNGYNLSHETGKITAVDGGKVYDFSMTKNVVSMLLSILILWFLLTGIAKKYKKQGSGVAPSGWQNALEPIIIFIRDSVAKPFLGKHYAKYMPLLLTIFFFIWVNNLLGLLPGGANLTGNIACTLVLALVFFVILIFRAKKAYWMHMINPPGVPLGVKIILIPIEILGFFIKPAALAIRLFANIFAGHTIILSLVCLIFVFGKIAPVAGWGVSIISVAFSVFMFFLELLVAAIQAFIFANLVAVFIGQGIEEHDDHHGHEAHPELAKAN